MSQDKTVKVGGHAYVEIDGDRLIVTREGGLVAVAIADLKGNKIYIHHPLSGWYLEIDMNREPKDEH